MIILYDNHIVLSPMKQERCLSNKASLLSFPDYAEREMKINDVAQLT